MLFALDPLWNDVYTAGGFWVGVISFLVGFIAFLIALAQLQQARDAAKASQSAAVAAREAAEKTLSESKDAFERFVGAFASRLLSELQTAVNNKEWKLAHTRANDLAELLATLPRTSSATQEIVALESTQSLRDFAQRFAELKSRDTLEPKVIAEKWKPLLQSLHTQLDHLRAPFRENSHGQISTDNPAQQISANRPGASAADDRRGGELGPETIPSGSDGN